MARINELYISYRKRYVISTKSGRMLTPKTKDGDYSKLTDGVIRNHLLQKYAVAILAGETTSRFVCFDVDDGQKETVTKVIMALVEMGFPRELIYVSFSGGKGYHVEMFFDKPVRTEKLKTVYTRVIERTGLDPRKVEFRPTHGSAIKLPLSAHYKTGNICWFVDQESFELIESYDYLLDIRQIPAAVLDSVLGLRTSFTLSEDDMQEPGEACAHPGADDLIRMDLEAEATRHDMMRRIAVSMRYNDHTRDDIHRTLVEWYERQDKSLIRSDRDEVMKDIERLVDWVFSEAFSISKKGAATSVRITPSDVTLALSGGNRSDKRVLFLLLIRTIARQNAISMTEISAVVGISRAAVEKAVKRLQGLGKLEYSAGEKIACEDGQFISASNRYRVRRINGRQSDPHIELRMEDVMNSFDACYHKAIHELFPGWRLRTYMDQGELDEHIDYLHSRKTDEERRLDLVGKRQEYVDEQFGSITAYRIDGRLLFPLDEVGRCIGWKNPAAMIRQCAGREKWKVRTSRQVVRKNFIEKNALRIMLEKCRSQNREALILWLCT